MAETTGIEWADATANFWIGCTKLSPACDNCYAEADWDLRKHRVEWGQHGDRSPVKAGAIVVRKMQRQAASFIAEHGRKPRIFVNSLSDFADNHRSIEPEWRERVWQLARECPDVILMILTKRPQNLPRYLPADWGNGYPNVWIGTTAENQKEADRRREHLRSIPAVIRFVSFEPALGPVDWDGWEFIDWLIAGGESGPNARPTHPDWIRAAELFCDTYAIFFFFKQWGEYFPCELLPDRGDDTPWRSRHDGKPSWRLSESGLDRKSLPHVQFALVGKKKAGRLLDGELHEAFPGMPA